MPTSPDAKRPGPVPRDGPGRPRGHRDLLDDRGGDQRDPVHDPAERPRHRPLRSPGVSVRGRSRASWPPWPTPSSPRPCPAPGGSYVYASRALNPYLGFVASFSQWFGLSIAIGVVSYVLIPFLRDIASALGLPALGRRARAGRGAARPRPRVPLDVRGRQPARRAVVRAGPRAPDVPHVRARGRRDRGRLLVRPCRLRRRARLARRDARPCRRGRAAPFHLGTFLAAACLLFSSFIGFDSIAQAGGEARTRRAPCPWPSASPWSAVAAFYMLFTAAVYHAVPWPYVAEKAQTARPDGPGPARASPAAGLDGGHRRGGGGGPHQRPPRDAARPCRG